MSSTIQGTILTQEQYNAEVRAWARGVRAKMQQNAALFTHGKNGDSYALRIEEKLKKGVKLKSWKDGGDTVSVAFNMPLHGIFRAYGVGRGQPLSPGKKIAVQIKTKREPSDWIDEPINKEIDKLADMAAEYYGDKIILKLK